MTKEKILKAVIEKAVKNGWNQNQDALNLFHVIENTVNGDGSITIDKDYWILSVWLNYVIFDIDFAKALWRDREWDWQHYIQQLAISEDRIEYLKQFIDEN